MTNTEQIRTKKISFILALSVIIFAAIATYFTLCHDINIMRITTPVILGLAMSIILCGVLQKFFYNWLTKSDRCHKQFGVGLLLFSKNRIRARARIDCFGTPKHRYPEEYERTSLLFSATIEGQDS